MKKIFRVVKGIVRGVRDVLPVPSKDAEEKLESLKHVDKDVIFEVIAEKITSRGVMILALIYAINEMFKLGLFN
jgi:hypothetical protein